MVQEQKSTAAWIATTPFVCRMENAERALIQFGVGGGPVRAEGKERFAPPRPLLPFPLPWLSRSSCTSTHTCGKRGRKSGPAAAKEEGGKGPFFLSRRRRKRESFPSSSLFIPYVAELRYLRGGRDGPPPPPPPPQVGGECVAHLLPRSPFHLLLPSRSLSAWMRGNLGGGVKGEHLRRPHRPPAQHVTSECVCWLEREREGRRRVCGRRRRSPLLPPPSSVTQEDVPFSLPLFLAALSRYGGMRHF